MHRRLRSKWPGIDKVGKGTPEAEEQLKSACVKLEGKLVNDYQGETPFCGIL